MSTPNWLLVFFWKKAHSENNPGNRLRFCVEIFIDFAFEIFFMFFLPFFHFSFFFFFSFFSFFHFLLDVTLPWSLSFGV